MLRVLAIEDDTRLAEMLGRFLEEHGIRLTHASDASTGFDLALGEEFDAVLLDVMLPDVDGFELCRRIRARSSVPILMLTARGEELDRVLGLELGADDYLPKPFSPRELLARLRAILRRASSSRTGPADLLRFGRLEVDRAARCVRLDGRECELTSHQFELLRVLAENAGRALSRDQIMDALRGHPLASFDRSIDVHVSRIRAAIEDDPGHPRRIQTVRGVGYVFARSSE
jgi:DNA-binding response OmpR family regulator